jgi:23S rRNA G2445 N2-methylase RlmL
VAVLAQKKSGVLVEPSQEEAVEAVPQSRLTKKEPIRMEAEAVAPEKAKYVETKHPRWKAQVQLVE